MSLSTQLRQLLAEDQVPDVLTLLCRHAEPSGDLFSAAGFSRKA